MLDIKYYFSVSKLSWAVRSGCCYSKILSYVFVNVFKCISFIFTYVYIYLQNLIGSRVFELV